MVCFGYTMTSEMPTAQLHHSIIFLSSFKHTSKQLHDFTLMAGLNSMALQRPSSCWYAWNCILHASMAPRGVAIPDWCCYLVSRCIIRYLLYIYMSNLENPRFTERTSTNLGRSHRLPHVCTIMIYGKLGGYRLQETAAFIYICDELWIICDIWVSLMWILEKYDDITLKRGIANLGRSHRLPRVFNNFHQFP